MVLNEDYIYKCTELLFIWMLMVTCWMCFTESSKNQE